MIPFRALGVLIRMASEEQPTIRRLLQDYDLGKDALQKDLKFLRENGYISLHKSKVGDRVVSYYSVTDVGIQEVMAPVFKGLHLNPNYRVFRLLYQQTVQSNYSLLEANKVIKIPLTSKNEDEMPYDFFKKETSEDEDAARDRERYLAKKAADKREAYLRREEAKRQQRRVTRREDMSKASWRPLDIAREFADRLEEYWHISPLSVVESKFVPALSSARLKHNTNGEIEYMMLQLFFEAMDFQKYNDAERVWKTFIARFNEFAVKARSMLVSTEQLETAKQQSDKSWEGFDE